MGISIARFREKPVWGGEQPIASTDESSKITALILKVAKGALQQDSSGTTPPNRLDLPLRGGIQGDFSAIGRAGDDVIRAMSPNIVSSSNICNQAVGLTTVLCGLAPAAIGVATHLSNLERIQDLNDQETTNSTAVLLGLYGFWGAAAFSYGGVRAGNIGNFLRPNQPFFGNLAHKSGIVGNSLWTVFFFFYGLLYSIGLVKTGNFRSELDAKVKGDATLSNAWQYILSRMEAPKDAECKNPRAEAHYFIENLLRGIVHETSPEFAKQIRNSEWKEAAATILNQFKDEDIETLGKEAFSLRKNEEKKQELRGIIGSDAMSKIEQANKVPTREEIADILQAIKKGSSESLTVNGCGALAGLLGLIGMVMALVCTSPNLVLISTFIALLGFAIMTYSDYASWKDAMNSSEALGKYDRIYLYVEFAAATASVALAIFLCTISGGGAIPLVYLMLFGAHASLVPYAISIGIGAAWMGVIGSALYYADKREARYKKNHATLDELIEKAKPTIEDLEKLPMIQREKAKKIAQSKSIREALKDLRKEEKKLCVELSRNRLLGYF